MFDEKAPDEHHGLPLVVTPNMFYWRGTYFTGLRCQKCNALWDNPQDSFLEHVRRAGSIENDPSAD